MRPLIPPLAPWKENETPLSFKFAQRAFCSFNYNYHPATWLRTDMSNNGTAIARLHEPGHLHYRLKRSSALGRSRAAREAEEVDVEMWAQALYPQLARDD